MKSTLNVVALSCLALWMKSGLSVPTASTGSTLINATYDDYQAVSGAGLLNPISIYDGVQYNDFSVANTTLEVTGLPAHSEPNCVVSLPEQQLTAIPSVTTVYSATPYSSMSVTSFWFGCFMVTAQGVASSTTDCNLQVTSYLSSSSSPYAVANYEFSPSVSDLTSSPMIQAILPKSGFDKVQRVTFQQSPALEVGFGIDNMVYTLNW